MKIMKLAKISSIAYSAPMCPYLPGNPEVLLQNSCFEIFRNRGLRVEIVQMQ